MLFLPAEKYHLTEEGHSIYQRLRTAVGEDYPVLDVVDVFILAVIFFNKEVELADLVPQYPIENLGITAEKVKVSLARLFEAGLINQRTGEGTEGDF